MGRVRAWFLKVRQDSDPERQSAGKIQDLRPEAKGRVEGETNKGNLI